MALFEPVDNLTKLYVPLWWYGQVAKLDDHSQTHCDLTPTDGAKFGKHGYIFDGVNDHLIDDAGREVLTNFTAGEWSSVYLTDGDVPTRGSIQGTGTKLYLNISGTVPKITGKIVLYSRYCPNLIHFHCETNLISTLDVSALTNLTHLFCYSNSISVLDVSALTSLKTLSCYSNSISVLDVSALTNLTQLLCYDNSISVLDVSALTNLMNVYCNSNSISVLDVSALTNLTNLYCSGNSISVLDVSALTNLTNLYCSGNSISVLDVSLSTSLAVLYCSSNSMNQAMVDTILCDVNGHGTSNGTLNISDNAAPSAAGIVCKNNLIARGWTVTTD